MDIIGVVIILAIVISGIAGLAVGLVKGFTKVKSWGVEYLLAALLTIAFGGIISRNFADNTATGGIIALCLAIAFLGVFMSLSAGLRKIFISGINKKNAKREGAGKKPLSYSYGVFNRLCGGFVCAVKGVVIAGFTFAFLLVALKLTHFPFVENMAVYATPSWEFFSPCLFDFFIIGVIFAAIKGGYSGGLSGVVWGVIVLGMVVFVGIAAYHLAFNVPTLDSAAQGFSTVVAGWFGEEGSEVIARIIIMCGIFLVMLVAVVLIAIFVPKLIASAREGKVFYIIDGVLGSIAVTFVVVALLQIVGGILGTISDLPFMSEFTSYFDRTGLATFFYDKNILAGLGILPDIPLRDWVS